MAQLVRRVLAGYPQRRVVCSDGDRDEVPLIGNDCLSRCEVMHIRIQRAVAVDPFDEELAWHGVGEIIAADQYLEGRYRAIVLARGVTQRLAVLAHDRLVTAH